MVLQANMVFGKRQKLRRGRVKSWGGVGGGGKVQKYNGPEVLQHSEPSIYRGGTTAREWQASGMHQEHLCTYKQHTQTYAQWETLGSIFLLLFLHHPLCIANISPALDWRHSSVRMSQGAESKGPGELRWECWSRCIAWQRTWQVSLNLYLITNVCRSVAAAYDS